MTEEEVRRIVAANSEGRQLGFLGEPRVNVLLTNLELDKLRPLKSSGSIPAPAN